MLNLSRIQLELERAKEGLREVEETIQKVEGKSFPNVPGRYSNLKVQLHSDKIRNPVGSDDVKLQRRIVASNIEPRNWRIPSDDLSYNLKRGPRDKRDIGVKRQGFDGRPTIASRLASISQQPADDDDEEEFTKKVTLPSRVITTAAEAPSRQEVIAAQTGDELSKQRNRRMFGALVGTLQKFCKEETRVREREEKRLRVEKKLEENAKREKEKLLQEKRELFLERKRREIEIKRIEWSLNRVKEYEAWEANVLPLKNFIQTHAKPHIFYIPSTHNRKTEERLAQSQKLVERMIEKRKNNLKEEIENSEKKARRTFAEEEDEEEAENIPQNSEPVQNTVEETMEMDYDGVNKENGFHEEGSKTERDENEVEHTHKTEEDEDESGNKGERTWSDDAAEKEANVQSHDDGGVTEASEEPEADTNNVSDPTQATVENRNKDSDDGVDERKGTFGDGGARGDDDACETPADERRTCEETEDQPQTDTDKNDKGVAGAVTKESDTDVPKSERAAEAKVEAETTTTEPVNTAEEGETKKGSVDGRSSPGSGKSSSKRRTSPSSARRSRSPGRLGKTRRRSSGSTSRWRKSYRRRSKSGSRSTASPAKKPRRDRQRRRSERTRKGGSPHSRARKRSSSRSSSSASPRRRTKFRSPSYSNSRSDSD